MELTWGTRGKRAAAVTLALTATLALWVPRAGADEQTVPVAAQTVDQQQVTLGTPQIAYGAPQVGPSARKLARNEMADVTNLERSNRSVRQLKLDKRVSRYAFHHSQDMAKAQQLYHTSTFGPVLGNRKWRFAGENIGVGTSIDSVETAFMNSPEHRANILDPSYRHVATGVYVDDNGLLWITVIFYG